MKIRVMTYNIQHGLAHLHDFIDLTKTGDVIRQYQPDIVGLNEVRGVGTGAAYTAQVETMASYLGYHCYFGRSIYFGGTEPYGNAILSRYPILEASVIPIPDPVDLSASPNFEPRSLCRCVIDVLTDGLRTAYGGARMPVAVYASHFGLSNAEREHAASTAVSVLCAERLPFVLMGDFNMEPDDPLLQPLFARFPSAAGLVAGKMSFPSHAPRQLIDYIFTSPDLHIRNADIPQVVASDHCPVWADLEK